VIADDLRGVTRDPDICRAYAADASGLIMIPDAVARPTETVEVVELLREAHAARTPVTAAGGQTSTTGASITDSGVLLSLGAMSRIVDIDSDRRTMRVDAGANLAEVKRAAAAAGLLFPPDPTSEEDVTIGGAIACNASGARSLRYGATRPWVLGLTVATAAGELLELRRQGLEKNTAGYALANEPVDWFVGSEGTLGVIVAAELALLPLPTRVTGLALPFPGEEAALGFVVAARESATLGPRCIEYFDALATAIAGAAAAEGAGPAAWPQDAAAVVYVEDAGDDEPQLDEWLALAEAHGALTDDVVAYDSDAELREARRARHAVPATMNERGASHADAGGRKLSTDWAVPYRKLSEALRYARATAREARIDPPVIYGHAGNGHPHENFIARDAVERERVEKVIEATLKHVLSLGGTVSAEHGIGKIKRRWLPLQATPLQLGVMRAIKRELDPLGLLAPGNVL
jgi:glycolate oxidase